jgi:hypothetical protein
MQVAGEFAMAHTADHFCLNGFIGMTTLVSNGTMARIAGQHTMWGFVASPSSSSKDQSEMNISPVPLSRGSPSASLPLPRPRATPGETLAGGIAVPNHFQE